MKSGFLSAYEGPISDLFLLFLRSAQHEVSLYQQSSFRPVYVQRDALDFLVMEGRFPHDDGFLFAVAKHTPVSLLYLRAQRFFEPMNAQDEKELILYPHVKMYTLFDLDQELGIKQFIADIGAFGK
ncbi:hypothetical protein EXS74_02215 [Candidatus Woesearchaeota archaeon]|nr:hypothetical protein [Candidatus Woesearchaeota archaeon]